MIDYDYKEFTEKTMFEVKLKNTIPRFGYMSCTNRHKFFEFCVSMGLIELAGTAANKTRFGYKVLYPFAYSTMGNYRPCKVECNTGHIIVVDCAYRPREKLNGTFSTKNSKYTHLRDAEMSDLDDA